MHLLHALADRAAKNCATPNSVVNFYREKFEAQWERTKKSGEENGTLIFYEAATNTYPTVELSQGAHFGGVPSLPQGRPETHKALADFRQSNRDVFFLAIFHTHPDFPGGDSRSGKPSGDDEQWQLDFENPLGIIRTSKGYSFFTGGRHHFDQNDPRANECIWSLNRRK
jgi:hypothetical protein